MVDTDEIYQQQFVRSLFNDHDEVDTDEPDDAITEHTWTSVSPTNGTISIIYHLAFLAPGHGDCMWNSSQCIAQHLMDPDMRSSLLGDRTPNGDDGRTRRCRYDWPPSKCIEFGAGAALPSLVLLREGAGRVIVTDRYVNDQTFDALRMSVDKNAILWGWTEGRAEERATILPHTWGEDVEELTRSSSPPKSSRDDDDGSDGGAAARERKADLLIASDCIYNPTYHAALLRSARGAMDEENGAFVVGYSFHSNVPPSQTLNFFVLAEEEFGLRVVREFRKEYDGQSGIGSMDSDRGTVYVKILAFKESRYCAEDVA